MKPTQERHDPGQSLWLDNITRGLLSSGTLCHYVDDFSVTGLTSNPSIFDLAIKDSNFYDDAIRPKWKEGKSGEALFFELAIEDLRHAADLFRPIHDATASMDGWVSLEVSPSLAYDTAGTIKEAVRLHAQAERPNLFIKIPGTKEGQVAIEVAIFRGVPVNVTLLFSPAHYIGAEGYLRGIERRIAAGLDPKIHSVASMFISRWDKTVLRKVPQELCYRKTNLPSVPRSASFTTLAEIRSCRRRATASALGERGYQRPHGLRCPLHQGAGYPGHHPRCDSNSAVTSRRSRECAGDAMETQKA